MITMIAAVSKNGVIGKDGKLPWRIPEDLKRFKKLTLGRTVVMGRKTYESIGRALPGRKNVVLTGDTGFRAEGCEVVHSIEEVLDMAKKEDVWIIGGAKVYEEFMPFAEKLYITRVEKDVEGDAVFPGIDQELWKTESEIQGKSDAAGIDFKYVTYLRRKKNVA